MNLSKTLNTHCVSVDGLSASLSMISAKVRGRNKSPLDESLIMGSCILIRLGVRRSLRR